MPHLWYKEFSTNRVVRTCVKAKVFIPVLNEKGARGGKARRQRERGDNRDNCAHF